MSEEKIRIISVKNITVTFDERSAIEEIKKHPFTKETALEKLRQDKTFIHLAGDSIGDTEYFGHFLDWNLKDFHAFGITSKVGAFVRHEGVKFYPKWQGGLTSLMIDASMHLKGLV